MRFANPYAWVAVALACLAFAVAGCGDDDEPAPAAAITGSSDTASAERAPGTDQPEDEPSADPAADKADISDALETVLTGDDPAEACGELVTERYLRRSYGDSSGCEAAQADAKPAQRVAFRRIVVLPDSLAQAVVEPRGGVYDDQTLRAELVLETGGWRLDSLRSNVPVGP